MKVNLFIGFILASLLVGACNGMADEPAPQLLGKWKSVEVEGRQTTTEFSYWEFFSGGRIEIVKWDDGRIEHNVTAQWQQISRNDSTFLILEMGKNRAEFPIFLYEDSLVTIDPNRLDRPYRGRALWQRVAGNGTGTQIHQSSNQNEPSDEDVITAVHGALMRKVPGPLVRYATGGTKAKISKIRINARGRPQETRNTTYWPVKAHATGTCEVLFGEQKSFDGEVEYFIYQDPYGEWKAEYRGL